MDSVVMMRMGSIFNWGKLFSDIRQLAGRFIQQTPDYPFCPLICLSKHHVDPSDQLEIITLSR